MALRDDFSVSQIIQIGVILAGGLMAYADLRARVDHQRELADNHYELPCHTVACVNVAKISEQIKQQNDMNNRLIRIMENIEDSLDVLNE